MGDNAIVSWLTSYAAIGNKWEGYEPFNTRKRSEGRTCDRENTANQRWCPFVQA